MNFRIQRLAPNGRGRAMSPATAWIVVSIGVALIALGFRASRLPFGSSEERLDALLFVTAGAAVTAIGALGRYRGR